MDQPSTPAIRNGGACSIRESLIKWSVFFRKFFKQEPARVSAPGDSLSQRREKREPHAMGGSQDLRQIF